MEFRNLTPFDAICYQMIDTNDNESHVIAIKVGYKVSNGECLVQYSPPLPLQDSDQFFGEVNQSAIRYESDFAPYKPKCDVIVNGNAYAPEGKEIEQCPVQLCLRNNKNQIILDKTLLVRGDSQFQYTQEWEQTLPKPFICQPINYLYAFGGENKIYETKDNKELVKRLDSKFILSPEARNNHPERENPPIAHTAFEDNIIGCGFADNWYLDLMNNPVISAPQIMHAKAIFDVDSFIKQLSNRNGVYFEPAGFGFISRAAKHRRKLAGTYDDEWLKNRHPYLPTDFDFAYWNGAPQDQQISYPTANFTIQITNMTKSGLWQATLPGHKVFVLLRFTRGELRPVSLHLDTVIIEPETNDIALTYRLTVPVTWDVRVIEARFEADPNAPLIRIASPKQKRSA